MRFADGAVYAAAKAGARTFFDPDDYAALYACDSTASFLRFLRAKEGYAAAFAGVSVPGEPTLSFLEGVTHRAWYLRMARVLRYAKQADDGVADYFRRKHEAACILACLRSHGVHAPDSYLLFVPDGFFRETAFDPAALERAVGMAAIREALRGTVYGEMLYGAFMTDNPHEALRNAEGILHGYVIGEAAADFRKRLSAADYAEVRSFLSLAADEPYLEALARSKRRFAGAAVPPFLVPGVTALDDSEVRALENAADGAELTKALEKTVYAGAARAGNGDGAFATLFHDRAAALFRRTTAGVTAALCYGALAEDERRDAAAVAAALCFGRKASEAAKWRSGGRTDTIKPEKSAAERQYGY